MGSIEFFACFDEFLAGLGALSYMSESWLLFNNQFPLFGLGREKVNFE